MTNRSTTIVVAGLAALGLAACASTVTGRGSGVPSTSQSTSATPSDTVSASPSDTPTPTPSTPTPTPTLTPTPSLPPTATAPASCPAATCTKVASADLGDGYQVVLRGDAGYSGGAGISVLELTYHGVSVFWATHEGETPAQLACTTHPAKRCIVVAYTGAHAAVGRQWRLAGNTLVAAGEAGSDTPNLQAADLNGDGYVDVRALQNNYEPDYATGKVYWQTWISTGSSLTSTGCGPLASTMPTPPTVPQTGACG